jgi:hypothetical protein
MAVVSLVAVLIGQRSCGRQQQLLCVETRRQALTVAVRVLHLPALSESAADGVF